jgi:alpha-beta hydrolase superfamily lysophospholipase
MKNIPHCLRQKKSIVCAALMMILLLLPAPAQADPPAVDEQEAQSLHALSLPVYIWKDASRTPDAIVLAFHGGCLHARSYSPLAERIVPNNFMLVATDMRGFGKWYHEGFGTRRDRTFRYKQSVRDAHAVLESIRSKYPATPIFLLGESLGASMAMQIAAAYPQEIDGAIIVSGYARPKLFLHPHMLVHFLQICINPLRRIDISPYLKVRLAENIEWAIEEIQDPLTRNKQSLTELAKDIMFNEAGKRDALKISDHTPVLVIHGTKDKLCDPKAMIRLFKRIHSHDKQFVLLVNRGHLLVETPHLNPVALQIMLDWIKFHSQREAALSVENARTKSAGTASEL